MNDIQIELTKLLGRKELTFGCKVISEWVIRTMVWDADYKNYLTSNGSIQHNYYVYANEDTEFSIDEIIGHPATLTDLHKWMNKKWISWGMGDEFWCSTKDGFIEFTYNSSEDLLDQEEETLKQIIELVKANSL